MGREHPLNGFISRFATCRQGWVSKGFLKARLQEALGKPFRHTQILKCLHVPNSLTLPHVSRACDVNGNTGLCQGEPEVHTMQTLPSAKKHLRFYF